MNEYLYSEKIFYRIARHSVLIGGMIILFSFVVFLRGDDSRTLLPLVFGVTANAFFFFSYAYITAYFLIPVLLSKKQYIIFALLFLLFGLAISFIKFVFSDQLFYDSIDPAVDDIGLFKKLVVNVKDMSFIVAVFLIMKYAKDNYYLRNYVQVLEESRLQSEIVLLKNRLRPHVLFNNLNNLYALAVNRPKEIQSPLQKFNYLLDYYFHDGIMREVPLVKEVKAIEYYTALERLRFGDRLELRLKSEGDFTNKQITPFVLFSFVEQCFEQGCNMDTDRSVVDIVLEAKSGGITFRIQYNKTDDVIGEEEDMAEDGVVHTRKKLELMYRGRYQLYIFDEPGEYSVELKLSI